MDRHSSTAAAAPSSAPAATASIRPVARPHSTETATMPAQMMLIVMSIHPCCEN